MAMRGKAVQALASRPLAVERRHVGLDPGLVDEHQASRIEAGLKGAPALLSADNVGAGLLKGEEFFLNRSPSRCRNRHTVSCDTFTPRAASSSFSRCSDSCGVWLIRSAMNARCGPNSKEVAS